MSVSMMKLEEPYLGRGTFFKYVRSFGAFFDPLPPLSAMCLHLRDPPYEYVRNSVPPP